MEKYLPILRNSPFFKGLTDNEILSILHCVNATVILKKRDSYIFRAGDSTEVMGLVVSGCVLVMQEDLWGHRNILAKCHAGDFFGEPYAASPGAVLNISVVANEDCVWLWKSAFGKYRVENERKKTGWMGNEAGCKKSRLKMWGSGKGQLDNQIQSEN